MPPGHGALDWNAIVAELVGIGYDGHLTVEFVASVDRSAISERQEIGDASEAGGGAAVEKFLRDHSTGAVPEAYYDRYAQESIDHLRAALGGRGRRLMPTVALIGTLDTKGEEIAYVRERLAALRVHVDRDRLRHPRRAARSRPTSRARRSPAPAGTRLADVRAAGSRGAAVALMREGVREVVVRQFAEGRVQGVLCLGGAEGALLGAAAMQALPVGVPKLLVSPCASGRRALRRLRRRERRLRHALRRRHPRPQRHLAADLRQRRGGDGRAWSATPARRWARSASTASGSRCWARRRRA